MRIAILTLSPYPYNNYGNHLQAFALQYTLKSMGHTPISMDIRYNRYSKVYKTMQVAKWLLDKYILGKKNTFKKHPYLLSAKEKRAIIAFNEKKGRKNKAFVNEYIALSSPLLSEKDMKRFLSDNQIDACIVGSDQCWRKDYVPQIGPMFCSFVPDSIQKISYAASFGNENWGYTTRETYYIKKLLNRFSSISVREESGIKLLAENVSIEAKNVLDPTLLVPVEVYKNISYKSTVIYPESMLMCYVLDMNKEKNIYLESFAEKNHLTLQTFKPNAQNDELPGVEDWLAAFRDAEFVITDSFHGTVFSILFKKPFYVMLNKERGISRFESILEKLGLTNRIITDIKSTNKINDKEVIDWHVVSAKLLTEIEKSKSFLRESLL